MSVPPLSKPTDTALAAMLLAENKRPTSAQELKIREAIPRLQTEVLKIEAEFNELDIALAILPPDATPERHLTEQLAQLSLQLGKAKDNLATHIDCISYGRQVPVEVLELIFAMCLDGEYVRPAPLKAPLLLCQICSSWRRVALVMPPLWTSLSLHLDRRPGAWKTFLETWMGRSGNGPISLSLTGKRTATYQYFNDHILKYFLKDSNRWRRLRLDVPATSLTKLLNTSMPLLETLEIAAHGTYPGVFISSADVPRLRILSLLDSQTNPTSIHVPWDRLTHFHAKYILDLDKAFPILAKCKNLKECTIYLSPVNGISASQHLLPLRMSRLRSLVLIGCIGEDAVSVFFAKLELPSLESMELANTQYGSFNLSPPSSFVSLARQSNLRSLILTGGRPLDGLFDTVVAIPSLKEVCIWDDEGRTSKRVVPARVQEALDMRKEVKDCIPIKARAALEARACVKPEVF